MHLGRVDLDLDGRANLRQRTRIHTNRGELVLVGHDLGSLSGGAIGDDVAVDVAIGAQILDVHNLQGEGVRVVSRGQASVLRTEADHDLAVVFGGELVDGLSRQVHGVLTDLRLAVDHRVGVQVHRRGADEAGDEDVGRAIVQLGRGADLLQDTELDDGDAIAHRQGLGLIVGHVQGGDTQLALQGSDLGTGLDTELGVEVGQRLIHEEDLRLTDDCTAHSHALTLTARQSLRLTIEVLGQVEDLSGLLDALADLFLRGAGDLQGEAHVVGNGHVRVQGVVLEHHCDVAVLRLHRGDVLATDEDASLVDLFEACEHTQGRRLTATRRADQHQEFAILDVEVQIIHRRLVIARVDTSNMVEYDFCHDLSSFQRQVRASRSVVKGFLFGAHPRGLLL